MTTADVQDGLVTMIEAIMDARDEVDGDGDDGTLANIARDPGPARESGRVRDRYVWFRVPTAACD
ncbi:MAG: hypothetical protein AMXMBFR58_31600 [Phycisphaerae bacterium]